MIFQPHHDRQAMKSLSDKLKQLSSAMEFANIDRIDELESLLQSRKVSPAAKARAAAVRRVAYCERKRGAGAVQAGEFATATLLGQH